MSSSWIKQASQMHCDKTFTLHHSVPSKNRKAFRDTALENSALLREGGALWVFNFFWPLLLPQQRKKYGHNKGWARLWGQEEAGDTGSGKEREGHLWCCQCQNTSHPSVLLSKAERVLYKDPETQTHVSRTHCKSTTSTHCLLQGSSRKHS